MTAWRVTYLPEPTAENRRPRTVTVEDPESPSLETFVARLSGGALGVEWTQGRVIHSVQAIQRNARWYRRPFVTAPLIALAVVSVVTAVVLLAFVPSGPLYQHPWSATAYTGASCGEGCFSQPATENFPNGSYVSGTWTASQKAVLFIQTSTGNYCPGGTPSSFGRDGSCSEPGVTFGTFDFTAVGGPVYFTFGSQNPENVSLSGYWSTWG